MQYIVIGLVWFLAITVVVAINHVAHRKKKPKNSTKEGNFEMNENKELNPIKEDLLKAHNLALDFIMKIGADQIKNERDVAFFYTPEQMQFVMPYLSAYLEGRKRSGLREVNLPLT